MSLNPTGTIKGWNYSRPDKEGYTAPDASGAQVLIGTIVSIQEVQSRKWRSDGAMGTPDFWEDGKPKMNIRIGIAKEDGSLTTFTFGKAGREARSGRKPSVHMSLFKLTGNTDMTKLVGKTVQLATWPANPTTGQAWGQGNPRLFDVQEIQAGPFTLVGGLPSELEVPQLLCNDAASGGQVNAPQPAAIQVPQVQPVYAQQPVQYAQPVAQPMVQPMQYAQPVTQPVAQPNMPTGMNPQVATAMQTLEATNVQPVAQPVVQPQAQQSQPYDESIPF